ncbi:phage tail assembly chaperone [Chakrabartyella piscis]|uniref:phage tail assembly chaperone n=1 Tax=Chakrabartyella piscis TaxID=2918914 RepID=UPI002958D3E5|nr:phage portal protein [Chakrabartyella piscis]
MEQSYFYKTENFFQEQEVSLSERLSEIKWKIRAINQRMNEEIWRKSGKNKDKYEIGILVASIVEPKLTDVALQKAYGVYGVENVLLKMLTPGEFANLQRAVEEINGGRR